MQKTTLIADSGSTKAAWGLVQEQQYQQLETQGISPYFLNKEEITTVLKKELLPQLNCPAAAVQQVFFYGTGVASAGKSQLMEEVLKALFPHSDVVVHHDLTGAARALCQREEGLACILGTGSGACYYDGEKIVRSSPGLGFILGDEGSGAYLGKILIRRYLYKTLDDELSAVFDDKYRLSKADILKKVYQEPSPNRFLASFSRFLGENRGNDAVEAIITQGINDFLQIHVKSYKECNRLPVHFVGGVAEAFQDVLTRLCIENGLHPGRILGKPLDGLVEYHRNR